jgi:hypothetical protein
MLSLGRATALEPQAGGLPGLIGRVPVPLPERPVEVCDVGEPGVRCDVDDAKAGPRGIAEIPVRLIDASKPDLVSERTLVTGEDLVKQANRHTEPGRRRRRAQVVIGEVLVDIGERGP